MHYKICPECGAHLDFGERCDCLETKKDEVALLQQERPHEKEPITSVPVWDAKVNVDRGHKCG